MSPPGVSSPYGCQRAMTPSMMPKTVTLNPAFRTPASIDLPSPTWAPKPKTITGLNQPQSALGTLSVVALLSLPK